MKRTLVTLSLLLAVLGLVGPSSAVVIIGGDTLNGNFNGQVTPDTTDAQFFSNTVAWENLGTAGNDSQATRANLDYDGTRNAVLAPTGQRVFAQNTGHSIAAGQDFSISYVWRDAWQWIDETDEVIVTLFVTDDDTLTGTPTVLVEDYSGLATVNNTYEEVVHDGIYVATPDVAGKILMVKFDAITEAGFARLDNFVLEGGVTFTASAPSPANDAEDVRIESLLAWQSGFGAATHNLYLGTNFDDVNNATIDNPLGVSVFPGLTANSFDPVGLLEIGKTYAWRIDEVNDLDPDSPYKGTVWTFDTEPVGYPISAITVSSSPSAKDPNDAQRTIDGSGLDENDQHSADDADMWLSEADPNGAWIQYDFDKAYQLYQLLVWNYNDDNEHVLGYGAKDVLIQYRADGETWMDLGTEVFDRGPGEELLADAQAIDLGGIVAQSIRLVITSNHSTFGLTQYGLSEVRFLHIPVRAREAQPQNNATGIAANATLGWRSGRDAVLHAVYVGTDPNALALQDTISETSFSTESLDLPLGTTVYWRIDELAAADADPLLVGELWTYTIEATQSVDNFEGYLNDPEEARIYSAWPDGYNDNTNGSVVGYFDEPYAETTIVRTGSQSMPLAYNNTLEAKDSSATRTFEEAQDWTRSGIQGLVLYFYGDPQNDPDQLYVKINDKQIDYEGEATSLQRVGWQKWYIPLANLTGVDLTQVTSFTVGLAGTGMGTVYIDDILLTPEARTQLTPMAPATDGLVSHWAFEGDAQDSAGSNHGTIQGAVFFAEGKTGQAIDLSGLAGDYVELTGYKGILGTSAITVTGWVNMPEDSTGGTILGWGLHSVGTRFGFRVNAGRLRFEHNAGNVQGDAGLLTAGWHHIAVVIQENAEISYPQVALYVDGRDDTRPSIDPEGDLFALEAGEDVRIGSRPALNDRFFDGKIDELYLYDRALTPAEIAGAAGRTLPFDI